MATGTQQALSLGVSSAMGFTKAGVGAASAGLSIGTAMVTAGIGAALSLFTFGLQLLAAHDMRVKIAKQENGALNQALIAFNGDLKTIFDAANKGDMTEAVAIYALQMLEQWYWAFMTPFQQGDQRGADGCTKYPGLDHVHVGACPQLACWDCQNANHAGHSHGQTCTAACDVGCNLVVPILHNAQKIFLRHGGALNVCIGQPRPDGGAIGVKYGFVPQKNYSLTYKKPAAVHEAEVTLNRQTGIISVGAPPSNQDIIVAGGAISPTATPDEGGVAAGIPTTITMAGLLSNLSSAQKYAALGLGIVALLLAFSAARG